MNIILQRTIAQMEPGTYGWTVPWALYHFRGSLYVRSNYTVYPEPGGTVQLRVERLVHGVLIHNGGFPLGPVGDGHRQRGDIRVLSEFTLSRQELPSSLGRAE